MWSIDKPVEPNTFDQLVDLVLRRSTPHLVYRGQRDYEWPLVCTLSRALRDQALAGGPFDHGLIESMVVHEDFNRYVDHVEITLLRVFMERAKGLALPGLPPATDRLARWELMQHHGVPTRLLDWTRSPFIALWFAFWHHRDADGDAAMWIFDTRNSWLSHPKAIQGASAAGWDHFLDDRQWQNRLAEEAIAEHAMVPLVISPRVVVPRVVAQQSILTLVPNVEAPSHFNHFVFESISTKVRLRHSWMALVLGLCDSLGITRAALFRDLDSIGDSLTAALTKNQPLTARDSAFRDYFSALQSWQIPNADTAVSPAVSQGDQQAGPVDDAHMQPPSE
jgi:hypothetical protein